MSAAQRHDGYYFASLVVFRAEDTLFRVPTYRFETMSSKFQELYPFPSGGNKPGASDWNPIVLEDIKASTFLTFLKVLYPECIDSNGSSKLGDDETISSAMTLAKKWGFRRVRRLLIEELRRRDLGPIRKLMLARIHGIHEWIEPELTNLARQETMISGEEAEMIGMELVLILLCVRERALQVATSRLSLYETDVFLIPNGCRKLEPPRFCAEVRVLLNSEVDDLDTSEGESESGSEAEADDLEGAKP